MTAVFRKELPAPAIDRREILRYMGCKTGTPSIDALLDRALSLCDGALTYSVCYAEYPLHAEGDRLDVGFTKTQSHDLAVCLAGCRKILLLAATVGLNLDRLILRYGKSEPSLALCLDAVGSERIEALCDAFCQEAAEQYRASGHALTPRFSAGYGDLPLAVQRDIFSALGCERQIGLTLNTGLMMSPTKSVTAIIGIR